MRFWRRITRYDPALRDERGAYLGDTWTSISDVGEEFAGVVLTLDEYDRVEAAYISSVVAFANDCGADRLEVRHLESGDGLSEGDQLSVTEAAGVVRRMLREEVVCVLESPAGDFAVHVGFDLYMYVGSDCVATRAIDHARSAGLFVDEDWPSPQRSDGG